VASDFIPGEEASRMDFAFVRVLSSRCNCRLLAHTCPWCTAAMHFQRHIQLFFRATENALGACTKSVQDQVIVPGIKEHYNRRSG